MAEGQEDRDTDDLAEEASAYRLEESRQKGHVSQSRELTGLLALIATMGALYMVSPKAGVSLASYMREMFRVELTAKVDLAQTGILGILLSKALKIIGAIVLPVALAGFFIGILGSFSQIGAVFSFDPMTPDFNKINPLSGFQRLFSKRHLNESIVIIFKAVILLFTIYWVLRGYITESPGYMGFEPVAQFDFYARVAKGVIQPIIFILIVFAAIDYFISRNEYLKQHRLTKQEQKEEYKEREGDPKIKARIRALQREMARKRMMEAVKKADVIITNPTHIAIAIVYDKDKMAAPRVVAKGADFLAQKIKKIASDAGVPMVENVPLARTLYKTVKIGQQVPRALYQAVAEVLAYVYRLKNRGNG